MPARVKWGGEGRLRARRRRRRALTLGGIVVLVLGLFGGVVWLSHAAFLQITTVEVSGAQALSAADVKDFVQGELAGDYWLVFSKRNVLTYPAGAISAGLLSRYPTLKSVDVEDTNTHTLDITISERQPAALCCASQSASTTGCYLMDLGGVVYAPVVVYDSSMLVFYGSLASSSVPGVRQYLAAGQFASLLPTVQTLAQKTGESIGDTSIDESGTATVTFNDGFQLLFPVSQDGSEVVQHYMLALTADVFQAHPLSDFEYLDLRFGDKLYYKLKAK